MSGALETKKSTRSDDQQARASNPEASVWVSANAGAGKTHALTTRVTRLLLAGTEPERILCLTYTKAAAAEMSSRLYQRLGDWAMAADEDLVANIAEIEGPRPDKKKLTRARQLFARAIETPGGLKIQTIHAFCQGLLGRFPMEANVPPNFNVLDERSAAELLGQVRDDVLAMARAQETSALGQALAFVVARIDETTFDKLLTDITRQRSAFDRLVKAYGSVEGIAARLRDVLEVGADETVDSAKADFFKGEIFPRTILKNAAKRMETGLKTDQKYAAVFASVLAAKKAGPALHDDYVSVFLKADGDPRKDLMTKKLREENPDLDEGLREEQTRVFGHSRYLKSVYVAEASEAILRLAVEILKRFAKAKRARAFLDYEDMIARTREMLKINAMAPWVLYKLDGGIDHVLVDEAQDTSPDQWDVIGALTEEFLSGSGARDLTRTIFAVGDEKQSIYSFQGADPKRFDEMQRHFAGAVKAADLKWDPVRLVRSFRSTPEVLQAVDAVFAGEVARSGLTASGTVDGHDAVRREDAGLVELWEPEVPDEGDAGVAWDAPLNYVSETDPRAKLADRVATTIEGWISRAEILPSKGRAIEPGDILILVRRRDAFVAEMVRLLKNKGIAVAGADRMVVTDEIAVMDLMALGAFTLLPSDDLTLAIVLKSPLIGLSEDELYVVADRGDEQSLWEALQARAGESENFKAAYELLARLLDRADFEPPYEFFAHVLGEEGGRHKILARLGRDANDPVDEFLNLALEYERDHAASMQGFLHWVGQAGAEIKRDMDKGRNEVRIMTVHGAKGLEAEIVFMPDTCAAPGAHHDPAFLTLPDAPPLLVWPVRTDEQDDLSAAARLLHREAQAQEYRRLLYVAMTRARDRLYVCGHRGSREPADDCWYNLIADALRPIAVESKDEAGRPIWRLEGVQKRAVKALAAPATVTHEAAGPWLCARAAEEPTPTRPLAPSRLPPDGMEEPPALSPLAGDQAARFLRGTLIHRLLQTLPELDEGEREGAARRLLGAASLKLDEAARDEIVASTLAVLHHPDFAEIFGAGSRAEAALVGQITFAGKPVLVSGQIDRLCVSDKRVLVIDYKTNRPAPMDLAHVSPAYFAQMAAYRAVLRDIYTDHDVQCALLWTDGPKLMELPAEMLDLALQGATERSLDLKGGAS